MIIYLKRFKKKKSPSQSSLSLLSKVISHDSLHLHKLPIASRSDGKPHTILSHHSALNDIKPKTSSLIHSFLRLTLFSSPLGDWTLLLRVLHYYYNLPLLAGCRLEKSFPFPSSSWRWVLSCPSHFFFLSFYSKQKSSKIKKGKQKEAHNKIQSSTWNKSREP